MRNIKLDLAQIVKKPEKAFLTIGLFFGILFLLVTPPFQVPDEPNHFFRAYQVSEGKFIAEKRDNATGGLIPKSLVDTTAIWQDIRFHPERKTTKQQFIEAFNISLTHKETLFLNFANTALYSLIPYLPQAIGIALGKVFNLSPIVLMYLGRLVNLLVSVYITFWAIRITPIFKWVFFLLALTPMAAFQRASLSSDSFINSISILLIATILNYAFDRNKERKIVRDYVAVLCLLGILLSLSKQAYFSIPFLCFLIPKCKIGNQKQYWITCLFICLTSALAWIAWSLVIKEIYVPLRPNVAVASEQLRFILSNPIKFTFILFNDFNNNLIEYLKQFFGVLGWLDTQLPRILIISYAAVLMFVALIEHQDNIIINLREKLKVFAILSVSIFLIYLMIYLSWTPVGQELVEGIQGRYFIPVAPLFLLLFYNRKTLLKNVPSSKFSLAITSYSLFAMTTSLAILINRYYNFS
jgi:uncharacterized membrane protein